MRIYTEDSLLNFEFWSGGKDTSKYLTDGEILEIENYLESEYPDGMSETEINDFFWFDDDFIAELLGYSDFDELMSRNEDI